MDVAPHRVHFETMGREEMRPDGYGAGVGLIVGRVALTPLSPTWALADVLKRRRDRPGRTRTIVRLNRSYLALAIASFVGVALSTRNDLSALQQDQLRILPLLWVWFLWSRATEVFWAFFKDAFDKLETDRQPASDLTPSTRVGLSLASYAEMVLNFSLIYCLVPASWWKDPRPASVTDMGWYSASTITTSGGGGYYPEHWAIQLLSFYEVACGLILLVVCFTIYTGLGPRRIVQ